MSPLDHEERYLARLSDGGRISQGFSVNELRQGEVFYFNQNVEPEVFREGTACPEDEK